MISSKIDFLKAVRPVALLFGMAITVSGCSVLNDPTGNTSSGIVGGVIGAAAGNALGANSYQMALAVILGIGGAQAINQATTGGCVTAGTTQPMFPGGHVFYNPRVGVIQCPVANIGSARIVDNLRKDPAWQELIYTGNTRTRGNRSGPQMQVFR